MQEIDEALGSIMSQGFFNKNVWIFQRLSQNANGKWLSPFLGIKLEFLGMGLGFSHGHEWNEGTFRRGRIVRLRLRPRNQ